ncbi:MAG: BspA family leucine-rich repeat surface protein [Clostridium sp.]|jgi:surface protein|nr:BspA family leucine-rich repeat surface protein [Clostridium sp.]
MNTVKQNGWRVLAFALLLAAVAAVVCVNVWNLRPTLAADSADVVVELDARVNDGAWNDGTSDAPVEIAAGDKIEYNIKLFMPKAMLSKGTLINDAVWWNQTGSPAINKTNVLSITIEDLPENYMSAEDFLDANNNEWDGKSIVKAWDATETSTVFNPDYNCARVIAWAVANGTGYDVFVGGKGGVYVNSGAENYTFAYFYNITSINKIKNLSTEKATDFNNFFTNDSKLTNLDLSGFDTSNVTDMSYMFYFCYALTSLNISTFDTSNVTDMRSMFCECAKLTSLDISTFDTSKVTDMGFMFSDCLSLTSLDFSSFNTSKVTRMNGMFYCCYALTSLDVGTFDTSNVTNMDGMFFSCRTLTSLDLSSFDTSRVTTMEGMFMGCCAITSLDLSSFDTSRVKAMAGMFTDCQSLTSLNLQSWDFSKVTNASSMFADTGSMVITVGTQEAKDFLSDKILTGQTINVVPLTEPKTPTPATPKTPTPATPKTPTPPTPAATPTQTVTDTIPDGLVIDEASISGGSSHTVSGQTITWVMDSVPATLSVKVTVASTAKIGGVYSNEVTVAGENGSSTTSNKTYHKIPIPPPGLLHIRQVALSQQSGTGSPPPAYFSLSSSDGTALPLLGGTEDYREYTIDTGDGGNFTLTAFVPQYYEYSGYRTNTGATPDSAQNDGSPSAPYEANGSIPISFSAKDNELWLTVYITQQATGTLYDQTYATNDFGVLPQ